MNVLPTLLWSLLYLSSRSSQACFSKLYLEPEDLVHASRDVQQFYGYWPTTGAMLFEQLMGLPIYSDRLAHVKTHSSVSLKIKCEFFNNPIIAFHILQLVTYDDCIFIDPSEYNGQMGCVCRYSQEATSCIRFPNHICLCLAGSNLLGDVFKIIV